MIKIPIDDEMRAKAIKQAKALGHLKGSIRGGRGNFFGFVGELAVSKHTGIPQVPEDVTIYDYDLVSKGGLRVEVKSKETTVVPKGSHDASVWNGNTTQECDIYFFTRVLKESEGVAPSDVFLMGWYPRDKFYEDAVFHKRGSKQGRFKYKADCYSMEYDDLFPWVNEADVRGSI